MRGRDRRWMRVARLVVACLAFVLARPAPCAAEPLDTIVLVARAGGAHAELEREDRALVEIPAFQRAPIVRPEPRRLFALQTTRALVDRKYLRHCALLC